MGQMTAGQVLAQVDDLLPNSYPGEQKRRWLRQAEGFVLEEVVRVHEGGQGAVLPGELTDAAELLAPAPYDGLYRHYVEAQIHYANQEYLKYNNAMALFSALWQEYANFVCRGSAPVGRRRFF